jgi:hypothetical protein
MGSGEVIAAIQWTKIAAAIRAALALRLKSEAQAKILIREQA